MDTLIGRKKEIKVLNAALASNSAELIAIYGRRRVGKTFLIRSVFEKQLVFEFTGIKNGKLNEQLLHFSRALKTAMQSPVELKTPANWIEAFSLLQEFLAPIVQKKKVVIFFDEFPWIQSQKSNFLNAFGYFWNTWASRNPNLKLVICGSAASWMIQQVVKNKGGLHNRITVRMNLSPFTLQETEAYLQSRNVQLDRYQLLNLYMVMGGIPQYLSNIQSGESATMAIDRICFSQHGYLIEEFDNLYASLFDHATHHIAVVKALAKKHKGLSRKELIELTHLATGGTLSKVLEELTESGFINSYIPFGKNKSACVYRLVDEYSLLYLKYMGNKKVTGKGTWLKISKSPAWASWSGYAFESICLKHIEQIKLGLGIEGLFVLPSIWRMDGTATAQGAQIDMILDREDGCINLCEMKFSKDPYSITKSYAEELEQKCLVFKNTVNTKRTLFLTMVTAMGTVKNPYFNKLIQSELTMDDLFS